MAGERFPFGRRPPKLKGPYLAAYEKWRQQIKANDGVVASSCAENDQNPVDANGNTTFKHE